VIFLISKNKILLIVIVALVASLAYTPPAQATHGADGIVCTTTGVPAVDLVTITPITAGVYCYTGAITMTGNITIDTTAGDVSFYTHGAIGVTAAMSVTKIGTNNILWDAETTANLGANSVLYGVVDAVGVTTLGADATVYGSVTNSVALGAGAQVLDPLSFTADRTALNTILLTFNKAVSGIVTSGSFTVAGSGTVTNTAPSSSTTVTLTTSGLTSTSSTPVVNYVAATGDIVDGSSTEVDNGGAVSAADSVAPTFTADRTALNTIVLQFTEPVDTTTTTDTDSFTVVGASAVSAVDDGGTTITLTTTGLTSTSSTPAVNYVAGSGDVVDASASGVVAPANGGAVSAADSVAPTFTADRTALNTIVLQFTEPVDTTTTTDTDSFTVVGASAVSAVDDGGTTITLTTTGLTSTSSTPNVTYVLANGDVIDASSNPLANGGTVSAADSVAPTFTGTSQTSTTTKVDFNEAIDGTLTFSQWTFDDKEVSAVSGQTDGATLADVTTLTFTHATTADTTPDISYTAGNLVDNSASDPVSLATATVTAAAGDLTAPTFTADRTAINTIVLTFDETVTSTGADTDNFTVVGASAVSAGAQAGGTTITLTTTGLTSTSSTPNVAYVQANGNVIDAASNPLANGGAVSAADSVAPTFTADRTALNTIVLQFTEPVDTTTTTDTDSFTVVGASAVSAVDDGGTTITLTTTGLTSTSSTPAVNYVAGSGDVVDASATGVVAPANGGAVSAADSVAPTISSVVTGDESESGLDKVTIKFSENVDATTVNGAGWTVTGTDADSRTVTANTDPADSSNTMVLTLSSAFSSNDPDATITYTSGSANLVDASAANNELVSGASPNIASGLNIKSARISDDTITIIYNKPVTTVLAHYSDLTISNGTLPTLSSLNGTGTAIISIILSGTVPTGTTGTLDISAGVTSVTNSLTLTAINNHALTLENTVALSSTDTEIAVTDTGSALSTISYANAVNATLNYSKLLVGVTFTTNNVITATATGITGGNVETVFAAGTVFTGPVGFTGIIKLPENKLGSSCDISPASGTLASCIEIGQSGKTITMDKPVKITLSGQAGNTPWFSQNGATTQITTSCTDNTFNTVNGQLMPNNDLPDECFINVGADLIIWTNHFTSFGSGVSSADLSEGGSGGDSYADRVRKSNVAPSFVSSVSKVGATDGDSGFGGILKSGPATDQTTAVIDSGDTVRLQLNLSDDNGLSDINMIEIKTNFKKESKYPDIPQATIYWTTFNDLAVYDKDGIFSDVNARTVEFDGDLLLFVDVTFDGFMATTDLEIRAYDKHMASVTETYENFWTLNSPIIQAVHKEPFKEYLNLIQISEDTVDYDTSGITGGDVKLIKISAELGDDCSNTPGKITIINSVGKIMQKINFRTNSDGLYDSVIGINNEWVPDVYTIDLEIGKKNISPKSLTVFSNLESKIIDIHSDYHYNPVDEFVILSSYSESITNSQIKPLVKIRGSIDTVQYGVPVNIYVSGNGIEDKITATVTASGEFYSYFEIDSKWNSGDYNISVDYLGDVIFTDVVTVDNQIIDESTTLVNVMEPESSLNSEYTSVYQRIDVTESIVMLLGDNSNEFETLDSTEPSNEFESATNFIMQGTINVGESRITPIVEIKNEHDEIVQTLNILTNNKGEFSVPVDISDTWDDGSYTATIMSGEFEITSTTFVVNQNNDVEPEILEDTSDQIIGEIFISEKDVTPGHFNITPGYFPSMLNVSGNVINYTHEQIDIDISKDSQSIQSLRVIGNIDGFFSVPIHIGNDLESGEYQINVFYLDELVGMSEFTIHEN
jgi:hypothetical protein